jgi:hypothetical protein
MNMEDVLILATSIEALAISTQGISSHADICITSQYLTKSRFALENAIPVDDHN